MLSTPGTPVSSTNKTDRHYITEILLKVELSTITLTLTLLKRLDLRILITEHVTNHSGIFGSKVILTYCSPVSVM